MACSFSFGVMLVVLHISAILILGAQFGPWIKTRGFGSVITTTPVPINLTDTNLTTTPLPDYNSLYETKKGLLFACNSAPWSSCYTNFEHPMELYEHAALTAVVFAEILILLSFAASCGICMNCCRGSFPAYFFSLACLGAFFLLVGAVTIYGLGARTVAISWEMGFIAAIVTALVVLIIPAIGLTVLCFYGDLVTYTSVVYPKAEAAEPVARREPKVPRIDQTSYLSYA